MTEPFPMPPAEMFRRGFDGFRHAPLQLIVGSLATLGVFAIFAGPSVVFFNDDEDVLAAVLIISGLVAGSMASYPWYRYALAASRGESIELTEPFRRLGRLWPMFVASFWFWAGALLGLRYLAGIPTILAIVFYAFYGFVVAEREDLGGLKALGTSVRLGDKRRIAIFALVALFGVFNFVAAATVVLFPVSASITLVAFAALYDTLRTELPDA